MSHYIVLFFISLCCSSALCQKCVTHQFESDSDYVLNNNSSLCQLGMSTWESGSYSSISVDSPNAQSYQFVWPNVLLSCASTVAFPMEAGGTVEVLVYMDANSENQLTVLVHEIMPGGNDATVGNVFLYPAFPTFEPGWQKLKMRLIGIGNYDGYLSFLGIRSEDSIVLIDSFRYIPPSVDEEDCIIYEDDSVTTTKAVTFQPIKTTSRPVESEKCFTYEFGNDFDNLFTIDRRLCDGFVSWNLGNYSSIEIDSSNTRNELFLSPSDYSSCISSFTFPMSPEGIVEVNVYMEPTSSLDHIIVLAKKYVPGGRDTVAGFNIYEPSRAAFTKGWRVIRISLVDLSTFDGYLIFLGQAAEGSIVLVDSFRYIPPWSSEDDESCAILTQYGY